MSADRNLLFGLLALQMDLLSRKQLIDGFQAWMLRKETPIGEVLRERGVLQPEDIAAVEVLINRRLARHQGDVQQSLAGLRVEESVQKELSHLDGELQRSLGLCAGDEIRTSGIVRDLSDVARRYRPLRPHARGGLGEVSVALDEELQREVALKEIQDRLADHPDARARFVREAEVTGNLEHPGIVPVYGLGVSPQGRPWYAMRFIKGESLHEAIKRYHHEPREPLELRRLLNRFVAVCNAIAYAHSRGVLHRDIKPANVMLGEYGETLVVDWGLARVLDEAETATQPMQPVKLSSGDSTPTEMGRAIGTPGYMPPEQATGRVNEIGRRSDVFSLGATLYHLLTGRAPYVGTEALFHAERGEVVPARRVVATVPRPLEAICARAMAKEPAQRYATARDLATEVEAYLADEPVSAYREPLWDRLRRWGRKHRTLVTTGVAVLLLSVVALTVGLGAVSAEQARTAEARDDALSAEQTARANERRAKKAEKEAKANLKVAEANLTLAKKAVNDTFDLAKGHKLLQQPGMQEVRKLLLEKALPFYKRFRVLRGDAKSQWELADQYHRVGYITAEISNKSEARQAYEQAEAIYRTLVKSNPAVTRYQNSLARTLNNIGLLLQGDGKRPEALKAYSQARDIQELLVKDNPKVTEYQHELAGILTNLGNLLQEESKRAEALKAYSQARDIQELVVKDNPAVSEYQNLLALTLTNMGNILSAEGKRSEALKAFTQARDIDEKLAKANPNVTKYQNSLARTLNNIGLLLSEEGKRAEALKAYTQARDLQEKLVKANPNVSEYQNQLALTLNNLGLLLQGEGKRAEAMKAFTQARDISELLVKANPAVSEYQYALAGTLTNMGVLLQAEGNRAEALKTYSQARDIRQKLVKDNPKVTEYQKGLAHTLTKIGLLLKAEGKRTEALKAFTQARDIREKLVKTNPNVKAYQNDLATTLSNMGLLLKAEGKRSEALKAFTQARDIQVLLAKDNPTSAYQNNLAGTLYNLGLLLQGEGKRAEALKAYTQARDIRENLVKDNPALSEYQIALAHTLNNLGSLRLTMNKPKEGLADLDLALKHLQAVLKIHPRSVTAADLLWRVFGNRALALTDLKRHADAAADWGRFLLVAPPQYRNFGRLRRANSLARAGQHEQAMKDAEAIGRAAILPASFHYDLACVAALCAAGDQAQPLPRREQVAETCAAKALLWLKQAHKAGFFNTKANRDHLLKDPDFAALRHRPEFKQFLQSLTP